MLLAIISLVIAKVDFNIDGDFEGIFILTGENGKWIEITDDLFPEDTDRLIYSYNTSFLKNIVSNGFYVVSNGFCKDTDAPCMHYEWNKKTGRGYIKTIYPGGKKLIICLSRFRIDDKLSSGLFLGGGLPPSDPDSDIFDRDEASMAYYDGNRYYHIWCNVNEGITDALNNSIDPPSWEYLGSEVLESSSTDLTIISRHRTFVNSVPITIERYLFYNVGNTYVTLTTRIKNVGKSSTEFGYGYGDEPWVGDYGTSEGDIGWLKDRLVKTEMYIDTKHNNFAGIFDYGNELAGEKHVYTNAANFIEWQQGSRPDSAYFSNEFGKIGKQEENIPLASHSKRVISLQWGKFRLKPNQIFSFTIAVGMATYNPHTKTPDKPDTNLN